MSDAILTIRTGLQGHGKTLNTIKELDAQAVQEGRIVYYYGVRGLKPELLRGKWFEFDDPYSWDTLPENSIIVIDEAQGVPRRDTGPMFGLVDARGKPEPYILAVSVGRQDGLELNLITQHPSSLHPYLRKHCGRHIHYKRIMGSSIVVRYELNRTFDDVDKFPNNKEATVQHIKLDSKFFDVYQSVKDGAAHHFNFKLSGRATWLIIAFVVALSVFGGGLLYVLDGFFGASEPVPPPGLESSPVPAPGLTRDSGESTASSIFGLSGLAASSQDAPLSRADWIAQRVPRIPDDPSSAPIYDELTAPVTFPRLSCVSTTDQQMLARPGVRRRMHVVDVGAGALLGCQCYTQQGTRASTSLQYCLSAVENGVFDHTRPDRVAFVESDSPSAPAPAPALAHAASPRAQSRAGAGAAP